MENEMSRTFYSALGQMDLKYSIELYTREITDNDPKNFAAWNNLGVNKVYLGLEEKNKGMIEDGLSDIKTAIKLAEEQQKDYPLAEGNVSWVEKVKSEI